MNCNCNWDMGQGQPAPAAKCSKVRGQPLQLSSWGSISLNTDWQECGVIMLIICVEGGVSSYISSPFFCRKFPRQDKSVCFNTYQIKRSKCHQCRCRLRCSQIDYILPRYYTSYNMKHYKCCWNTQHCVQVYNKTQEYSVVLAWYCRLHPNNIHHIHLVLAICFHKCVSSNMFPELCLKHAHVFNIHPQWYAWCQTLSVDDYDPSPTTALCAPHSLGTG